MSVRTALARRLNEELNAFAYNRQALGSIGQPVVFQVELTNNCPMTCEMCPRTYAMTRPLGHMEFDLYTKIIDEAAASTSRIFLHHFGDSLVHPRIGECVAYARRRGIAPYLSANPVLLTRSRIEALVDSGLEELVLSLDGLTSATSAQIRGRAAANVELAERRIHDLLEYRRKAGTGKPEIVLQIVRQQHNRHEVDAWLAKWSAVDEIDRVKVKSYVTWDGSQDAINELRPDPPPARRAGVVCDKPWTSVTVLWDGSVVPCCFDYNGKLRLGNVKDQSLGEVWRAERLRELRRCHRDGDLEGVDLCQDCTDYEGFPVRKWYYPLNRFLRRSAPLGDEWDATA